MEVIVVVEGVLVISAYLDKYVQLMKHEQNKDLLLLQKRRIDFLFFDEIKTRLPVPICWGGGGGGSVVLGSFIIVEGGGGGWGWGANCESCCAFEKSFVDSIPCVVGIGNWTGWDNGTIGVGWVPIVNFGWINDDVCWVLVGFNGVNADDVGWNALGIDGGRIDGWIKGDEKCETDVGGWRSGFNDGILFKFCWNNKGEPLGGAWLKLFGAGNRGLNGVFAELRNGA